MTQRIVDFFEAIQIHPRSDQTVDSCAGADIHDSFTALEASETEWIAGAGE